MKLLSLRVSALPASALAVAIDAMPALSASSDAWEEFRVEVKEACLKAAEGVLRNPEIVVDPFGSESYGIAVLTGPETGGDDQPRRLLCVFDKQSRKAEVGGPLEL